MVRLFASLCVLIVIALPTYHDLTLFAQGSLPAIIQERLNQHMSDEDRRWASEENFRQLVQAQSFANEARLTKLETIAESNIYWLRAVGVGMVLIAFKELFLYGRLRKETKLIKTE